MNSNLVLAIVGVLGASVAYAEPVTYDFIGAGEICTYSEIYVEWTCVAGQAFTGTVAIEVVADGPSGPDSDTDGSTFAYDRNGWVRSTFVIRWDSTEYEFALVPGFQDAQFPASVDNNAQHAAAEKMHDALIATAMFSGESMGESCERQAVLHRWTTDLSWLNDLSFNLSVGLAPGSDAVNVIFFANTTLACSQTGTGEFDRANFYGRIALTSLSPAASVVAIDIKPGDDANSINPRNRGLVSVAVLSSADFDATQLDSSTVAFGPGAAPAVRDGRVRDVNGDGYPDLFLHFSTQATGIICGSNTASITGRTFGDERFVGSDSIRAVGCK